MSDVEPKRPGQIILGWWSRNIGDRKSSHARALAARLRRAGPVEVLGESAVHELAKSLQITDAAPLVSRGAVAKSHKAAGAWVGCTPSKRAAVKAYAKCAVFRRV